MMYLTSNTWRRFIITFATINPPPLGTTLQSIGPSSHYLVRPSGTPRLSSSYKDSEPVCVALQCRLVRQSPTGQGMHFMAFISSMQSPKSYKVATLLQLYITYTVFKIRQSTFRVLQYHKVYYSILHHLIQTCAGKQIITSQQPPNYTEHYTILQ